MINAENGTVSVQGTIDEVVADIGVICYVVKNYIQKFEYPEERAKELIRGIVEKGLNVKKEDTENE